MGRGGGAGRADAGMHSTSAAAALCYGLTETKRPCPLTVTHTTCRTAQAGLNCAALARVASECTSECTPPTLAVHVPNGHVHVASLV